MSTEVRRRQLQKIENTLFARGRLRLLLAELVLDNIDRDEDLPSQDFVERLCVAAFGDRVPCPAKGTPTLPSFRCCCCDWIAPE